jgi:hypothetical protein
MGLKLFNKIIGIIGPKGSGKTFDICRYLKACPTFACFVIFRNDVGYLSVTDEVITENPRQLAEAMKQSEFRIVYHPSIPEVRDGEFHFPFFDKFVEICFRRGNCTMVIDEAHLLCDARNCPPYLLMSLIDGRRRNLNIVYVSHRFATVSRMLTANTDEFWLYKITESADLDEIRKRCGAEAMEKVKALRRLEKRGGEIIPGERFLWSAYDGQAETEAADTGPSEAQPMDEKPRNADSPKTDLGT